MVTFLAKTHRFVNDETRRRLGVLPGAKLSPEESPVQISLVGDALTLAPLVAHDSSSGGGTFKHMTAIDRLRAIVENGGTRNDHDKRLLDEMRPLVEREIKLVDAIAKLFNLQIRAASALEYMRQEKTPGDRPIADRVMKTLGAIFRDGKMNDTVDVSGFEYKVLTGNDPDPSHFPTNVRYADLVRGTLPARFLDGMTQDLQVDEGYYAAMEAGLDSGVIEGGGTVLTYNGSKRSGGNPRETIIMEMKRLAKIAAGFGHVPDLALARAINERLLVSDQFDGIGLFPKSDAAGVYSQPTDPLDLRYGSDTSDRKTLLYPLKLPLILCDGDDFRPATHNDVMGVVMDTDGGGITDDRGRLWAHHLRTVAKFYEIDPERLKEQPITGLCSRYGVSHNQLVQWVHDVVEHRSTLPGTGRTGERRSRRKHSLVPDGKPDFAGALVETIARHVIDEMKE